MSRRHLQALVTEAHFCLGKPGGQKQDKEISFSILIPPATGGGGKGNLGGVINQGSATSKSKKIRGEPSA